LFGVLVLVSGMCAVRQAASSVVLESRCWSGFESVVVVEVVVAAAAAAVEGSLVWKVKLQSPRIVSRKVVRL